MHYTIPTMQASVNAPLNPWFFGNKTTPKPPSNSVAKASRNESKMGNALARDGEKKAKEFEPIIERCYENHFRGRNLEDEGFADFFRLVCETVEEINKKQGNTQFRVPKRSTLEQAYATQHQGKGKLLTEEEFRRILQEVILDTGFTGVGAKDILFYLFGVPVTALLIKQRVAPGAIPNEIFIPGITSATVFLLAKLNKI